MYTMNKDDLIKLVNKVLKNHENGFFHADDSLGYEDEEYGEVFIAGFHIKNPIKDDILTIYSILTQYDEVGELAPINKTIEFEIHVDMIIDILKSEPKYNVGYPLYLTAYTLYNLFVKDSINNELSKHLMFMNGFRKAFFTKDMPIFTK